MTSKFAHQFLVICFIIFLLTYRKSDYNNFGGYAQVLDVQHSIFYCYSLIKPELGIGLKIHNSVIVLERRHE